MTYSSYFGNKDILNYKIIHAIMNTLEELKQKLQELERAIAESKKRIPPHSVKPPVMMDLFDLEDQYDEILKKINKLKQNSNQGLNKK